MPTRVLSFSMQQRRFGMLLDAHQCVRALDALLLCIVCTAYICLLSESPTSLPCITHPTRSSAYLSGRSMTTQLIAHERILTTATRAAALQRYADGVIALAKKVEASAVGWRD
jgi:hypothetical protein